MIVVISTKLFQEIFDVLRWETSSNLKSPFSVLFFKYYLLFAIMNWKASIAL